MNLNRYLVAGALSLTLHSAMLWSAPENTMFAMPVGSKSNSVSVNFMKAPVVPAVETKTPPVEKIKQVKKVEPKAKSEAKVNPVKKAKPHPVKSDVKKKKTAIPKEQNPVASKSLEPEIIEKKEPKIQPVKPESKKITEPESKVKQQASADAKAGVTDVPQLVSESRFAKPPQPPSYPRLAKRKGIEGTVVYEVWLDENGKQMKIKLKDSSGTKMLDKAASKAIAQWKFLPRKVNGQAVAHRVYVPVKFKLD
ncbi:energy transducer TonB [Moritella sp. 24]|uniref:energy transducer TonB n=1 Tax=Moritella sp. 24 TaxID=2746230 RepID=UPI001BADDB05|nr:energy transducer TonB [Moritella sp. 24]QUM76030.1 energy transducer TonB [Moritella sp. 24]